MIGRAAICVGVGIAFVLLLLLIGSSSPMAADVAALLLRPGEVMAGLMGYAAHDFVGFLCVIPGNMLLYAGVAFAVSIAFGRQRS